MAGTIATQTPKLSGDFATVMSWADKYRTMKVRTNADTPDDAKRAREFGAEGIGLCRTEHMFFEGERIKEMRAMILAEYRERAAGRAQRSAAAAAQGLHRHFQSDERLAGDDPAAGSAAARVPAARPQDPSGNCQGAGHHRGRGPRTREPAARNESRCSATAAAAWR